MTFITITYYFTNHHHIINYDDDDFKNYVVCSYSGHFIPYWYTFSVLHSVFR